MRSETVTSELSGWNLTRIPAAPGAERFHCTGYGVNLTEISIDNRDGPTACNWSGYPYVSLKR